jgi:hypothetical protein
VIIFGSVRFLSKKSNQTVFLKKKKPNRNRFKPTGFGSVILEQKPVQTGLARFFFWFGLVFFCGLGSVRFFRFQAYKTETEPNRSVFSKF